MGWYIKSKERMDNMGKSIIKKVFVSIILFAGLIILLKVIGNTYETSTGMWMKYKWYPIISSERIEESIQTNEVNIDVMRDIFKTIESERSKSYLNPQEEINDIIMIDKMADIKELRSIYYKNEKCLYCIFTNPQGGKQIVLFSPFIDKKYIACGVFFLENRLNFEDFKEIKVGAHRKDVISIDSATDVNISNYIDGKILENSDKESVHITNEGYVKIEYDSSGYVISITEVESEMIQMIKSIDL